MGHSQAEKAASRERILEAAAQQISERGLDSVAVAELMQNAGLTKGAFYGHFESRDAMIAEAARRAMQNGQDKLDPLFEGRKPPRLEKVIDVWLDPEHVDNLGGGCGICTLAGEARYAGPQVQQVVADQFKANVAQIARALGDEKRATARATAILTAIVGAVSMARAVGDPGMAKAILANTRAFILKNRGAA
ncbi:TetR/AcrR family transcriptional regulator [Caballeronia novacaledonica]|uniref:TetR/AcrR family transcriptional regulator n=1 Tax=Caballeronia novacaledonica TaxID=1544861 RepID=A0ACB5R600_9BURK|nr:TetR/AcrR family transcriptional regulator [Caballeronia novacaledonica]